VATTDEARPMDDRLDEIAADVKRRLGEDSGLGLEVKLELGAGRFVFVDARAVPHAVERRDEPADCCIALSESTYRALADGALEMDAALRARQISITGENEAARRFLAALSAGPRSTPR
jgi:hypothetical protein